MPLLPLFPLEVVLLPGTPLPLHIFEPRYKEMIAECLANRAPFGVARAIDDGTAKIGCTAEIVTVTKEYSDGRLDLITQGIQRFEVLGVNHERSFLRAEISLLSDDESAPRFVGETRAVELHREILSLAGAVQDISGADPSELSFHLAGSLPLELDFKQALLGMRSENERRIALAEHFESLLAGLRRAARTREKTGGNGRLH